MFSFFKKAPPQAGTELERTLREHLRDVDEDALHGVLAVAGLVVKVAMQDDKLDREEETFIRGELGKVGSLGEAGIAAVLGVMRAHAKTIAEVEAGEYARWLGEKRDLDFRRAVLQLLVEVARSHEGIDPREREGLARITTDMQLTEEDLAAALEETKS